MLYLMQFLFVAGPLAAIIAFAIFLSKYRALKKRKKEQPDSVDDQEIKRDGILMTVFAVIAGVIVLAVVGFMALLFLAIAFM